MKPHQPLEKHPAIKRGATIILGSLVALVATIVVTKLYLTFVL